MYYLDDRDVKSLGIDWEACIAAVARALAAVASGDFAQPVKPYLRYRNPVNRIIAMPAFVGGGVECAGIKWVASFPRNLDRGMPRAHSVVLLNDPETGVPLACLNAPRLNVIRTAAVSAFAIRSLVQSRPAGPLRLGIIGWGPVGRGHFDACYAILGDRIAEALLHDLRGIEPDSIPGDRRSTTRICRDWREVYEESDIFVTCTVSEKRYVQGRPPGGALLLDVSLRDFHPSICDEVGAIVVDDWSEVCREDTDIERMHLEGRLDPSDAFDLVDLVGGAIRHLPPSAPVLFCPMGMAVFDLAIARHYLERARQTGHGQWLS